MVVVGCHVALPVVVRVGASDQLLLGRAACVWVGVPSRVADAVTASLAVAVRNLVTLRVSLPGRLWDGVGWPVQLAVLCPVLDQEEEEENVRVGWAVRVAVYDGVRLGASLGVAVVVKVVERLSASCTVPVAVGLKVKELWTRDVVPVKVGVRERPEGNHVHVDRAVAEGVGDTVWEWPGGAVRVQEHVSEWLGVQVMLRGAVAECEGVREADSGDETVALVDGVTEGLWRGLGLLERVVVGLDVQEWESRKDEVRVGLLAVQLWVSVGIAVADGVSWCVTVRVAVSCLEAVSVMLLAVRVPVKRTVNVWEGRSVKVIVRLPAEAVRVSTGVPLSVGVRVGLPDTLKVAGYVIESVPVALQVVVGARVMDTEWLQDRDPGDTVAVVVRLTPWLSVHVAWGVALGEGSLVSVLLPSRLKLPEGVRVLGEKLSVSEGSLLLVLCTRVPVFVTVLVSCCWKELVRLTLEAVGMRTQELDAVKLDAVNKGSLERLSVSRGVIEACRMVAVGVGLVLEERSSVWVAETMALVAVAVSEADGVSVYQRRRRTRPVTATENCEYLKKAAGIRKVNSSSISP
mmetsp:Transcript_38460/g.68819  ORF Transcript_38460/g.68819 Transcript_38460/m.68819 type:complete len:574 (-) Transcript_38460:1358-3079(-)